MLSEFLFAIDIIFSFFKQELDEEGYPKKKDRPGYLI
jgi:hypothetical protein